MAESLANVCVSDGVIWIPHTESHFSSSTNILYLAFNFISQFESVSVPKKKKSSIKNALLCETPVCKNKSLKNLT
jgi:hypothetical protein